MNKPKEQHVKAVLGFLDNHKFYKAKVALEQESKVKLHSYGKELDFFYDLLMDGRFEDAEQFIQPLKSRSETNYKNVLYQLRKQNFLEMLESSNTPELDHLVTNLKSIEDLATKEDFNTLCYCLSLNKITDHPDYKDWCIWSGRMKCFQNCLDNLSKVYPITNYVPPKYNIEQIIECAEEEPSLPEDPEPLIYKSGGFPLKNQPSEPSRYSLNFEPEPRQFSDLNESSGTDRVKKSVSWNVSKEEIEETKTAEEEEEDKRVFIEALDIPNEDTQEEIEEEIEETIEDEAEQEYVPTSQELMNSFDPSYMKEIAQVKDVQPIRACCFNSDGDYFVLGTNSKSLKVCSLHNIVDGLIYNEQQGREQYIDVVFEMKNVHYGSVYCVDWSREGTFIASGSNDKTIRLVTCPDFLGIQETNSETVIYSNGRYLTGETELPQIKERTLTGHSGTVRALAFHPVDEKILLSGGIVDTDVKVWNTETGQCYQNLKGKGSIYSIAISGDGSYICSGGTDRTLRIWDLRQQKCALALNAEGFSEMNSVSINSSAEQLRAETKSKIAQLYRRDSMQFPEDKLAAVGHCDGVVSLWELTAGKLYSKYTYHSGECRSVDFSCNAQWLSTGSFDSSIGLVNITEGSVFKLEPHMERIVSTKWHPSLPILLSTSADKTARIFSI